MTPARSKWKLFGSIALLFLLGVGAGALGAGLYFEARIENIFHQGPPEFRKGRIVEKLTRDLDLTPQQQKAVRAAVAESETEMRALRQNFFPRMKKIRKKTIAAIRNELTPEQRTRFDELNRRLAERFRRRHPPFHAPHEGDFPPPPPSPKDNSSRK